METRMTDRSLLTLLLLLVGSSMGSSVYAKTFKFCGSWRHGNDILTLSYNLSPGCENITVSANDSSLSVVGQITTQCTKSGSLKFDPVALSTNFCVHWEPLKDHLWLELPEQKVTLCESSCMQTCLCGDLSPEGVNRPVGKYGIAHGSVRGDSPVDKVLTAYVFLGEPINCTGEELCDNASQRSNQVNITKGIEMGSHVVGNVALPKTNATVVEMKENFQGFDFKAPAPPGADPETLPSIHLPPSLKPASRRTATLVCTFFRNKTLFQEPKRDVDILEDVVGITVENEVITNLAQPIRIGFHHDALPKTHSRKCVSWDTKTDPQKVNWKEDGCVTVDMGAKKTECHCNHLTYFTIMVRLERGPVPHLLALTVITSFGNAVSIISCVALIVLFLYKKRGAKEQSSPVHLGLAVSLFLLNLFFFFTGTLANVGGEGLCRWVGAGLHYALLSSFAWMAIEVFYTFWMVYKVFSPSPTAYFWYLIGFALPALPVLILVAIGNIYGIMEVVPSDDPSKPYLMCWMRDTPQALLAHYLTNISMLVCLVSSGLVMLFLVYWKIRDRNEWRHKKVAFLSILGLSCLFGTSWGLCFLGPVLPGPLSTFVLFLSCILNSFQGFFLMLRFYVLGRLKKREEGDSTLGSSSLTGSTRQQMLQVPEKQ